MFVRMLLVLGGMVVALLIVARVLPRILGKRAIAQPGKHIEVIEARRLDPRKSLFLIKVGNTHYLLGGTESRLEMLTECDLNAKSDDSFNDNSRDAIEEHADRFGNDSDDVESDTGFQKVLRGRDT